MRLGLPARPYLASVLVARQGRDLDAWVARGQADYLRARVARGAQHGNAGHLTLGCLHSHFAGRASLVRAP